MKRFLTTVTLGVGLAILLLAQVDPQYQTWMKTAGSNTGALKKAIDAKSTADAQAAAKTLEGVFGEVAEYWEKRGDASDAVGFAKEAQSAAKDIAAAESLDAASASFGKLGAACKNCHAAHREKADDGTWKIK